MMPACSSGSETLSPAKPPIGSTSATIIETAMPCAVVVGYLTWWCPRLDRRRPFEGRERKGWKPALQFDHTEWPRSAEERTRSRGRGALVTVGAFPSG